jgi:2'-5' RNA ligase
MRLFVAIDLNDEARRSIAAEQKRIADALAAQRSSTLKWVRPDHMHLTLAFLGEVNEGHALPVIEAMGSEISDAKPFAIALGGLGVFPPHGAPRVLWLGLLEGAGAVVNVQRGVVDRLSALGITLDERVFHPHLTLARWRRSRPADRRLVAGADRGAAIARVEVLGVTLYQSRLSSSEPTYTALVRAPFAHVPSASNPS